MYCECGCGQVTAISAVTNKKRGTVRGRHLRYVLGHNAIKSGRDTIAKCWEHGVKPKLRNDGACLLFTGSLNKSGYGQIWLRTKPDRLLRAHRVAYEATYGPIPDGLDVLHSCDRPACCNPEHLRAGTPAENLADAISRGRLKVGPRHPDAVYTESDVARMRAMFRRGLTTGDIAKALGAPLSSVSNIVHRRVWKHMD